MIKNILNVVEIDRTRKVVERRGKQVFITIIPTAIKTQKKRVLYK